MNVRKYKRFQVKHLLYISIGILLVFVIYLFFRSNTSTVSQRVLRSILPSKLSTTNYPLSIASKETVSVLYVVDGDTISVSIDGKDTRVRMIGIDSPEKYEGKEKECYADEASAFLKNFIQDQQVILRSDSSQDDIDIYKRLLRYVFLENGTHVNSEMIRNGFAREYTYRVPYMYQKEFQNTEMEAQKLKRGLWGVCSDRN